MKQQFNSLDKDGDGYITTEEFTQRLKESGRNPDDFDASKYFNSGDENKDGKLTFTEFLEAAQKLGLVNAFTATGQSTANLSLDASFKQFDRDGDGKITTNELEQALDKQGGKPSQDEIKQMISAADKNKDGTVDKEEFATMMN